MNCRLDTFLVLTTTEQDFMSVRMSAFGTLQPFAEEKWLVLTVRSWHKETFNAYGYVSNLGSHRKKGIRHTPQGILVTGLLVRYQFQTKSTN